ncbi:phosphohydrolase [Alcaligenaceae bacterium]|nr:phosphohydrolase [Alcaligenaceae bacterium]
MELRAWMRLPSGRHLDLINPDPSAWDHQDLSIRLSRTYRWGGESCWPLPLSVAQHSLLVLELRRQANPRRLGDVEELFELLHDAEEGFLGFDCISPLKAALGAPFQEVANRLTSAIMQRYRLPDWNVEDYRLHKAADRRAAASEAVHCVGWSRQEVSEVLGIQADIADLDPLAQRYGDTPWAPWSADVAARRFHDELIRLCASLDIA